MTSTNYAPVSNKPQGDGVRKGMVDAGHLTFLKDFNILQMTHQGATTYCQIKSNAIILGDCFFPVTYTLYTNLTLTSAQG